MPRHSFSLAVRAHGVRPSENPPPGAIARLAPGKALSASLGHFAKGWAPHAPIKRPRFPEPLRPKHEGSLAALPARAMPGISSPTRWGRNYCTLPTKSQPGTIRATYSARQMALRHGLPKAQPQQGTLLGESGHSNWEMHHLALIKKQATCPYKGPAKGSGSIFNVDGLDVIF